jgi:chromosome partitioning protein
MNIIVFASRKGGSGKSTLAGHLAAYLDKISRSCLLIDADPQGSLTLWHRLRKSGEPALNNGLHDFTETIERSRREGFEWVLVDTPPLVSEQVNEAIRAAALVVIPVRPSVFDLNAVMETIAVARSARKLFSLVLNAVPPKRLGSESPMVAQARRNLLALDAPVWSGQITHRTILALALAEGEGAEEYNFDSRVAAKEIAALWAAIENSVKAIHGAYVGTVMHQHAA